MSKTTIKRGRGRPHKYDSDKERRRMKAKKTKESQFRKQNRQKRSKKRAQIKLIENIVCQLQKLGKLPNLFEPLQDYYEEYNLYVDGPVYNVYVSYRMITDMKEVDIHIFRHKLHIHFWLYWNDQNSYHRFPFIAQKYRIHINDLPITFPSNYHK